MRKIFLILPLFFFFIYTGKSQDPDKNDTLGIVEIYNSYLRTPDTLVFDLYVKRFSDVWRYWSNGTYQFEFYKPDEDFNYSNISMEIVPNTSELDPEYLTGEPPYKIWAGVFDDRFSVFVLGPDKIAENAKYINRDTALRISTFKVYSHDGSQLPGVIQWKLPLEKWQANAFKVDDINLIPPYIRYAFSEDEDNIEMDEGIETMTSYQNNRSERPEFVLNYFRAEYAGAKTVTFDWETYSQINNLGFSIYKALRIDPATPVEDLDYSQLVATYKDGSYYYPGMEGETYSWDTLRYFMEYDTVNYRGGQYCYKLTYNDIVKGETDAAYSCINVPNAVIVEAKPSENPFNEKTVIQYKLEDDVHLTIEVYDLIGRYVKTLKDDATGQIVDNLYVKKGYHEATFTAKELSSQGLYNVIITARPVDDNNIDLSRAVVKTQYVRN